MYMYVYVCVRMCVYKDVYKSEACFGWGLTRKPSLKLQRPPGALGARVSQASKKIPQSESAPLK